MGGARRRVYPWSPSLQERGRTIRAGGGHWKFLWQNYLAAIPWQYWYTITFKQGDISPAAARRAITGFQDRFNPDLHFWVTEDGRLYDRTHLHGLLYFVGSSSSFMMFDWTHRRYGWCRFSKFDPERGGIKYVTKYLVKQAVDWDMFRSARAPRFGDHHPVGRGILPRGRSESNSGPKTASLFDARDPASAGHGGPVADPSGRGGSIPDSGRIAAPAGADGSQGDLRG